MTLYRVGMTSNSHVDSTCSHFTLQAALQSQRAKLRRRSTVTTVQRSELRKASSAMRKEMSKLQQSDEDGEDTSDIASSSTATVATDFVLEKRFVLLLCVCHEFIKLLLDTLRTCVGETGSLNHIRTGTTGFVYALSH